MFAGKKDLRLKILSWIFTALILAIFVGIEVFVFTSILKKIKNYEGAAISFFTVFLFIISVLMIFTATISAKKLFFNQKDIEQLATYPISNTQKILSKLIFLFGMQYVINLVFTYPLFVAYGSIVTKNSFFYFSALFYPVIAFLFEAGVALVLVYPFKMITDFLRKHLVTQFIITVVGLFAFVYLYGQVLNLFITLVASNQLESLFNADVIASIIKIKSYLIPTNFLTDIFIHSATKNLFPLLSIGFGVFLLGLIIAVSAYNYFCSFVMADNQKEKGTRELRKESVNKALIRKELILLFKDSSYLFSFTGLLIIAPFLVYLVVYSMNTIFTSGNMAYYVAILPNFIPLLDILMIMLITLIVSQGANNYITMENKNIRLIKTLPVSIFKQLGIKVLIPFGLSFVSMFISYLALLIGGVINFSTFLGGFILTAVILAIVDLVSLYEELKIKRNKPRGTFLSTLYTYGLPIIYFIATIVLSYFEMEYWTAIFIGLGLLLFISLFHVIGLKSRVKRLFDELEVVN
jgi:ABC-2 type transport system permease protein